VSIIIRLHWELQIEGEYVWHTQLHSCKHVGTCTRL